jgi:hypothetical protein
MRLSGLSTLAIGVAGSSAAASSSDVERTVTGSSIEAPADPGCAVLIRDAIGQDVRDRFLLPLRHVHTEGVIQSAVLADQDDNVLDRAFSLEPGSRIFRIPLHGCCSN